jgi:hypothetical protein
LHSSSIRSINLYSFHSPIRIDQKKVLREPYLGVAAVAEEEASVDGGGGDQQSAASTVVVVTGRVQH